MKVLIFALLVLCAPAMHAQNNLTVTLDGKAWKPKSVSAGVESAAGLTLFTIIGQLDKERLDISIDYSAIKGKKSATFTFSENLMVPPGGASISYAPKGLGREQWSTAKGTLTLTDFNEASKTASGTFEGTITIILDDKGSFVMASQKPTKKISGKFEKIPFTVVK